jgi:TRAP-type C4-dicarboxylate transport system substrate-binding protein
MKAKIKKNLIVATIVLTSFTGGTVFATASMFDELKDDYHKEIKAHMDSFVRVDHSKRVQTETRDYLNQKLAAFDREANELNKKEADQAIADIKRFIDAEIATHKGKSE